MVRVDRADDWISAETIRSKVDLPARPISAMDGHAMRSVETMQSSSYNPVRFDIKRSIFPDTSRVPKISDIDDSTSVELLTTSWSYSRRKCWVAQAWKKEVAVTRKIQRIANMSEC